jgi:hypothetical protein
MTRTPMTPAERARWPVTGRLDAADLRIQACVAVELPVGHTTQRLKAATRSANAAERPAAVTPSASADRPTVGEFTLVECVEAFEAIAAALEAVGLGVADLRSRILTATREVGDAITDPDPLLAERLLTAVHGRAARRGPLVLDESCSLNTAAELLELIAGCVHPGQAAEDHTSESPPRQARKRKP